MIPSLAELEAQRDQLFEQLRAVGDFRAGSVSENYRRCGKPNCACATPRHPGHGPRLLCEARPVDPPGARLAGKARDAGSDGEKGGSFSGSRRRSRRS